ncbi:MAG: prephenate/arogenate dehydrogenase family protein [Alphaproteobacteria bacterium]
MPASPSQPMFDHIAILGFGLIGSSLARAIKSRGLAARITGSTLDAEDAREIEALDLADRCVTDPAQAVIDAELVIIATPVGSFAQIAKQIAPNLRPDCIVTDVGSVKEPVETDIAPNLPDHARLVPGHPIAGTENSGHKAGFAELFDGRWCILTPMDDTDPDALARVTSLWEAVGSDVATMSIRHHDRVLAITSHLPHLIAYTIVATATDLEQTEQAEVIKYSAGGFRDFTRIAASDPVMWRDVFLTNKEAVLEILQRFSEDLTALQRAIRWEDGDQLEQVFTRTRKIRREVIDAKQAE